MHPSYIGFNTNTRDKCVKQAGVQSKSVGKRTGNGNNLSNNCQVKGKTINFGSYNVSNVNCGSGNKHEPKVVQSCRDNSEIQTVGLFEDVNKFACLQQVSDNNTDSVMSDSSIDNKNDS